MGILSVILVILAIALIVLILLQHGKGADAGASFGGGASGTVFGAAGSASFLSRVTAILATLFFAVSLMMYVIAARQTQSAPSAKSKPAPSKTTDKAAEKKDVKTDKASTKTDAKKAEDKTPKKESLPAVPK